MQFKSDHHNPIRLDRYIKTLCNGRLTQGVLQKLLRQGFVLVNGKKCKDAGLRVNIGDVVYLNFEVEKSSDKHIWDRGIIALAHKLLSDFVVYQNDSLLIINKPHGLATQGGTKVSLSIDHAIQYLNSTGHHDMRLVHRLDKETSGLMLIAKNRDMAVVLGEQFRDRRIKKKYLAKVMGRPYDDCGAITSDDQSEVTLFKTLRHDSATNLTDIEFTPITGKKHQIRRHAALIQCPIFGDSKYCDSHTAADHNGADRMYLHSAEIEVVELDVSAKSTPPW